MHRSSALIRVAIVMAVATCAIASLTQPVAAADPVRLQARALVAGRFEVNGWAAINVTLENDGEPVSGDLVAEQEYGVVRHAVELPGGSRKQVTLYVRPAPFGGSVGVTFEQEDGTVLARGDADVAVLDRQTSSVAVVGDAFGALRPQLAGRGGRVAEPIGLRAADIPERPEPLEGIEAMVWAADSTELSDAQGRALERWVASGGQLVVIGGPEWQSRTAAFSALLPVEGLRSVDGVPVDALAGWAGGTPPAVAAPPTASVGDLRQGATGLVHADAGILAATVQRGAGRVSWLAFDLGADPFGSWDAAGLLWSRFLPDAGLGPLLGFEEPVEDPFQFTQALSTLPSLDVPPAELVLAVIFAYILLIGPVSYVALRRFDRRELAWVTAPALVLVFSATTYGIGSSLKGSEIILNQIAVVRTNSAASSASVSTYAGVFSPSRARYDLSAPGEALFSGTANPFTGDGSQQVAYTTEQGDPSRLRGLAVGVFGLESVRADSVIAYQPALSVAWSETQDGITGTVANGSDDVVEDVAVVSPSGGKMLGDLAGGESVEFTITSRDLNGSSASEKVYGFGGFDVGTEEQRRMAVRRQVIDAIVGFATFPGRVAQLPSQGPFVVGWRLGEVPVPIEIDGHDTQRYSHTVEVLGDRPLLGPGSVHIGPASMAIQVVSTQGDASFSSPEYVSVSNGEVVFQIGLPIESAGLSPSSVTLVAGTDAGSVFYEQPNFAGLLPDGFRMALYDVQQQAWVDVGDLSQRSRFILEDPLRALDPAGRILVRVTASGIPDEVGAMPIFAGAIVEGVLP